jgi:hypothetical protein
MRRKASWYKLNIIRKNESFEAENKLGFYRNDKRNRETKQMDAVSKGLYRKLAVKEDRVTKSLER